MEHLEMMQKFEALIKLLEEIRKEQAKTNELLDKLNNSFDNRA
jgi:hypothetical protein